jgi:hypothetical protein
MEKTLTGLFGSGPEADAKTARAQDFVKRYSEGAPDQGYSTDEAVGQLNQVLRHANSQQVEAATKKALNNMPENQRAEFGQFVNQLHARQSGDQTTSAGSASVDDISRMFGQAGGSANSVNDLFGSLLGGGAAGGVGGMVSNVLGGLFGGDDDKSKAQSPSTTGASQGGGLGDLGAFMNSTTGKMVLGGIAAYLTKELMNGRK